VDTSRAGFAGLHYTFHEMLINEAFVQIKKRNLLKAARLDEIIDRHAAIEARTQLDDDENGAPDQYKPSMRLNGVSLRPRRPEVLATLMTRGATRFTLRFVVTA
jgi:hypothetical protein